MKTTITLSVDGEIKQAAMPIIQNQMDTSLSCLVNDMLKKIVAENREVSQ